MASSRSRQSFLCPPPQPCLATTSYLRTRLPPRQSTTPSPPRGPSLLASPILSSPLPPPIFSISPSPSNDHDSSLSHSPLSDPSLSPFPGSDPSLPPSPVLDPSLPPYTVFHPPLPAFTVPHIPLVPSVFLRPSLPSTNRTPIISPHIASSTPPTTRAPIFRPSLSSAVVRFRHPGYPDEQNIMFSLPVLDHGDLRSNGDQISGLDQQTALRACSIIACNAGGFLAIAMLAPGDPQIYGPSQSPPPPATLLLATEYYYYPFGWSPQDDPPYPVSPNFWHWAFPHGGVPEDWNSVVFVRRTCTNPLSSMLIPSSLI